MVFYRLANSQKAKKMWDSEPRARKSSAEKWERIVVNFNNERLQLSHILVPYGSKKMMRERIDLFVFSLVRTLSWGPKIYQSRKRSISYGEKGNENINMSGLDKWFWAEHSQSGISLNLRTWPTGHATLFNQWEGALVFINKQIKTSPQWSKIFKTTDGVGQNQSSFRGSQAYF